MNKTALCVFSFLILVSSSNVFGNAVDLSKGGVVCFSENKGTLEVPYSPEADGLRFEADTVKSSHIQFNLKAPVRITSYSVLYAKAIFQTENDSPVSGFDLRLRDRDGEICAVRYTSMKKENGIITVEWKITPEMRKITWGTSREKQNFYMDLPLQVFAIGIGYERKREKRFSLTLRSLELQTIQNANTISVLPLYSFGEDCTVGQSGGYRLFPSSDLLMVADIHPGRGWIREKRKSELIFYREKPHCITLDAETLSGEVQVSWSLKDAAGKLHTTSPLIIAGKKKSYRFFLSSQTETLYPPYRVERLNLRGSGNGRAVLLLHGSRIHTYSNPAEALKFDLFTGTPVHILKNEEREAFCYLFHNTAEREGRFRVEISLTPWHGSPLTETVEFTIKAGETLKLLPKIQPERNGHWTATARISVPGAQDTSIQSVPFAKLTPAGPTPVRSKFLFGICSHPERWSRRERELEAMAAALCGAKYLRATPGWGAIQPAPDRWNFKMLDRQQEIYSILGIEQQGFLGFNPQWAVKPELRKKSWQLWSRSFPDRDAFSRYAATMADRYRGRIRYWELCNEPDLARNAMTADEFSELQKIAWKAVKSVNPAAVMMSGGFSAAAEHPGLMDKNFMETVLRKSLGSYEIHLIHNHGSFGQYVRQLENHTFPLRKRAGAERIPWFPNETGLSSLFGTERAQALALYKKLIYSWANGAVGYVWYDLRNDGFDAGNGEHNYGMMTTDFYPKPVYSVYNHLAGTFRNAEYDSCLSFPEGIWGFLFRDSDNRILSLWNELEYPLLTALRTDAETVFSSDFMGNETRLPIMDGIVLAEAANEPKTYRFSHAGHVQVLPPLIQVDQLDLAIPGKKVKLRLKLNNPFRSSREFFLSLANLPSGFQVEEKSLRIPVPAARSLSADFNIRVPSGKQFPSRPESLLLKCESNEIGTALRIPLNSAILIRKEKKGRPDFKLNRKSQLISLTEADPELEYRIWKGPKDLSADIRLSRTDTSLELRVDVTDDIHCQPYSGFSVWQGDNLQICFRFPSQQDFWELGASLLDSGKTELFVFHAPENFKKENILRGISLKAERTGNLTSYRLNIPLKVCGLTAEQLRSGFRFNLLVNENDGDGRDGWLQIAPGIGESKNPERFPFLLFE